MSRVIQRPRYGVRLNFERREYQVYDVITLCTIESFGYIDKELSRGVAHGRANLCRERFNRQPPAWREFAVGDTVREIDGRHLGKIVAIFGHECRVAWCSSTPVMTSVLRLDEIERVP